MENIETLYLNIEIEEIIELLEGNINGIDLTDTFGIHVEKASNDILNLLDSKDEGKLKKLKQVVNLLAELL